MPTRRTETLAFATAVALHAALLFVLRAAVGEPIPASTPQRVSAPARELAVELDLGDAAGIDYGDLTQRSGNGNGVDERSARSSARVVPRTPAEPPPSLDPESGDATPNGAAELDVSSEEATATGPIDLGIGPDGWKRWVTPNADERPATGRAGTRSNRFQVYRAPPVSTSGGLQEGLEERDRALGLGPSGRVLSALHRAAHQTVAPQVGVARFDVTVLRTGAVEVTLGGASGEMEEWKKVAKHVADDLRASPPTIKPPRKGVRLVVELVAEETMPNGTKITSLEGPHLEVTPPKLESTKRSVENFENDNPTTADPQSTEPKTELPPIKLDLPGVYLAERGKVCSYRLGLSPLGPVFQGGCDPAHIGAKPQRMVRARVVEQTMF